MSKSINRDPIAVFTLNNMGKAGNTKIGNDKNIKKREKKNKKKEKREEKMQGVLQCSKCRVLISNLSAVSMLNNTRKAGNTKEKNPCMRE